MSNIKRGYSPLINGSRMPQVGRLFIAPYKMGSESARVLADVLDVKRVDGNKIFRTNDVIINWGNSSLSPRGSPVIINSPDAVALAANKISSFQRFNEHGVATVEWTTDRNKAALWMDQGFTVYGRSLVSAHSGHGIYILSDDMRIWRDCALYTKAILKAHEYRVHVFNGKVIDIQKKRRRNDAEVSEYIKNLDNGWVFCRDEVVASLAVYKESISAVQSLGLHFGAVDILYKEKDNRVAVLEVNSSPGLEGSTLDRYAESFRMLSPPRYFLTRGGVAL